MSDSPDFITSFFQHTHSFIRETPEIFRIWAGISLVASALERRVWVHLGGRTTFPNMYILFVAVSGHGKGIIDDAKKMFEEVKDPGTNKPSFHLMSHNVTKPAMLDELAKALVVKVAPEGQGAPISYHALSIFSEELSTWLKAYDAEMYNCLISLWNNLPEYKETRRTSTVKNLNIEKPVMNFLGGTQPCRMAEMFPDEAWFGGLTRRMVMIYSYESDGPRRRLSEMRLEDPKERKRLLEHLARISQMYGEMQWAPDAYAKIDQWDAEGCPPVPAHTKLEAYNKSRIIFVQKLAMISAISRTGSMTIELLDVERGMEWLFNAERTMTDIFKAMVGKSDAHILEELYWHVLKMFTKLKGGVPYSEIRKFLANRATSERHERLLTTAEHAGYIHRIPGDLNKFVPGDRPSGDV